jgi:hypothetical protein
VSDERKRVSIVQHVSAEHVRGASGDVVAGTLVPQMRAQLARKLATDKLRPLDGWPAVTVLRYRWAPDGFAPADSAPLGMREARDGETPDLYVLELRTDAVPDKETVAL